MARKKKEPEKELEKEPEKQPLVSSKTKVARITQEECLKLGKENRLIQYDPKTGEAKFKE